MGTVGAGAGGRDRLCHPVPLSRRHALAALAAAAVQRRAAGAGAEGRVGGAAIGPSGRILLRAAATGDARRSASSLIDIVAKRIHSRLCLLYTSDAADDLLCVDLGGRR